MTNPIFYKIYKTLNSELLFVYGTPLHIKWRHWGPIYSGRVSTVWWWQPFISHPSPLHSCPRAHNDATNWTQTELYLSAFDIYTKSKRQAKLRHFDCVNKRQFKVRENFNSLNFHSPSESLFHKSQTLIIFPNLDDS